MLLGKLAGAHAAFTVAQYRFAIHSEWRTAEAATFELCPPDAGPDSFDDQRAFQLGHSLDVNLNVCTQVALSLRAQALNILESIVEKARKPAETLRIM